MFLVNIRMDSTEIFDFEYTYRYHGNINFESKYIMIADSECKENGAKLLAEIDDTNGIYDEDYTTMGPIRNKENWRIYLKIKDQEYEDEENVHEEVMDIILINQKLFDKLPEKTDEKKIDGLFWLNDSSITIKHFGLMVFDCKYFDDIEYYQIPDNITFNQFMYEKITENDAPIAISVDYGLACFVDNGDISIYQITDSKNDELLAINIEIIPNNHMDSDKDTDSNSDIDLENYGTFNTMFNSIRANNFTRKTFSNVNSGKTKTI